MRSRRQVEVLLESGFARVGAAGWLHDAEIAQLQRAHAEIMCSQSELALAKVQAGVARITGTAAEFVTIQSTLAPRMTALTKELRDVPELPAGLAWP